MQLNHLMLLLRLSGVRYTLPHMTSFCPAVILSATNYVYVLSELEGGGDEFYVLMCEVIGCADDS